MIESISISILITLIVWFKLAQHQWVFHRLTAKLSVRWKTNKHYFCSDVSSCLQTFLRYFLSRFWHFQRMNYNPHNYLSCLHVSEKKQIWNIFQDLFKLKLQHLQYSLVISELLIVNKKRVNYGPECFIFNCVTDILSFWTKRFFAKVLFFSLGLYL